MKQSSSLVNYIARWASVAVAGMGLLTASVHAEITVDFQTARSFTEGREAKMVFLNSGDKSEVQFIDFSDNPLKVKTICDKASGGNPQISPDGSRVAFDDGTDSYIAKVEENTQSIVKVGKGIVPHWWIHPQTKKEYLLLQRGIVPESGNGIFTVEIGANNQPVGEPQFLLEDPMANAGRSADGKFLANNDEEHDRCWRGHGLYEIEPVTAISNASIKYWVYVSEENWWGYDNKPYAGYCNGAMCPSGPGAQFYGAMLHMGSGHKQIYIRQPKNYENMEWVRIKDAPESCPDTTIHYTEEPQITLNGPESYGIGSDTHWGYSDWSTHHDYITATVGTGRSSKNNKKAYIINLAKFASGTDPKQCILQVTNGGVAQPDMWLSDNTSTHFFNRISTSLGNGYNISFENGTAIIDVQKGKHHSVHITDLMGKTVYRNEENVQRQHRVDLSKLAQGVFIVRVKIDEMVNVNRIWTAN